MNTDYVIVHVDDELKILDENNDAAHKTYLQIGRAALTLLQFFMKK